MIIIETEPLPKFSTKLAFETSDISASHDPVHRYFRRLAFSLLEVPMAACELLASSVTELGTSARLASSNVLYRGDAQWDS